MKKYRIKARHIDKCMDIIETHCYNHPEFAFTGEDLEKFCSNRKNLFILHNLASLHKIRMIIPDGSKIPVAVLTG